MVLIALTFMVVGSSRVYNSFAASTPPSCAKGSYDIGLTTAYDNGEAKQIRLCRIYGFRSYGSEDGGWVRVSSNASARWVGLFQAALRSGITLEANSSFRSNKKQTELYNCWIVGVKGCNRAAKPGYSNHQTGTAIDIDIVPGATDPTLTACRANPNKYPVYKWLSQHASNYSRFARVEDECWHWSDTGR